MYCYRYVNSERNAYAFQAYEDKKQCSNRASKYYIHLLLQWINTMVMIHLRFVWSGKSEYLRKLSADWERGTNADWQHWVENCQLPFLETQRDQIHFFLLIVVTTLVEGILVTGLRLIVLDIEWPGRGSPFYFRKVLFQYGNYPNSYKTHEKDFLTKDHCCNIL